MPPAERDQGAPLADSRYARQAVLPQIGPAGQARLAASSVLVVGCGALGSAQAELAARAGIGRLVLVDRDVLELHNLQRQLLFDEEDVRQGLPKAVAAARRLQAVNSEIQLEAQVADLTADNVLDLLERAELVLDGTDNFETRYLLNDACVQQGKPWIYGGVLGTEGMVLPIRPPAGPCLRCTFPEPPGPASHPTCETAGVLNTAVAWVAALQLTLALKLLLDERQPDGASEPAVLRVFDIWQGSLRTVRLERDPDCPCCGQRRFEYLEGRRGSSSTVICGRNAVQITPEQPQALDLPSLAARLAALGAVSQNGLVLELRLESRRLVIFPDGRVLVLGTTEVAEARSLVARCLGA